MRVQLLTALLVFGWTLPAHSHGEHADAPGAAAAHSEGAGPIRVSPTARRNLGLEIELAELRPIQTSLRIVGEIVADPQRTGTVSSRIAGHVTAVYANEGEHMARGQLVVEIESLQIGDPPPRVRYHSPIRGTVLDRHVVVGDDVEPNRHLFEIADLGEVLAVGHVFEGQIGQVEVGQTVRVRVPSFPETPFEGVVERLGGMLDRQSRSLPVFVRVLNPEDRLRPHMRATLSLVTAEADLALTVPRSAVLGEGGALFAFVQREDDPDLFDRRAVEIGMADDRYVETLDGLLPGDRVVIRGNYSLQYLPPEPEAHDHPEPADVEGASEPSGWRVWWPWTVPLALAFVAAALALRIRARSSRGASPEC